MRVGLTNCSEKKALIVENSNYYLLLFTQIEIKNNIYYFLLSSLAFHAM